MLVAVDHLAKFSLLGKFCLFLEQIKLRTFHELNLSEVFDKFKTQVKLNPAKLTLVELNKFKWKYELKSTFGKFVHLVQVIRLPYQRYTDSFPVVSF